MALTREGEPEMDYGVLSDKLALIDLERKQELLEEVNRLLGCPAGHQSSESQEQP